MKKFNLLFALFLLLKLPHAAQTPAPVTVVGAMKNARF
jgi:hypothetical protein